jgi:hypothetical protein
VAAWTRNENMASTPSVQLRGGARLALEPRLIVTIGICLPFFEQIIEVVDLDYRTEVTRENAGTWASKRLRSLWVREILALLKQ